MTDLTYLDLSLPEEVLQRKQQKLTEQQRKQRERDNRTNGRPRSYNHDRDHTDALKKLYPNLSDEQLAEFKMQLDRTIEPVKRGRVMQYWRMVEKSTP
ncbi:hypothetical protein [Vibrio agarivorans]|uniref:hypothetical protein n=1 Tax=Vibrio agarivorans TaxID=153622 RepID=UPI0025B5469E|nr:hypothetical protein [Vibrio agarivorans]MDN3659941.1 hypothetical protein [Vibrio agarivorans]